jgi:hypothetical protein
MKMTYKVQIDDLIRDANADEISQIKANEKHKIEQAKILETKLAAKSEILNRLGLSDDEFQILFG